MRCRFAAIENNVHIGFARRAGGQVVRKICVVVSALRRSVSFYGSLANWEIVEFPVIASQ